MGGTLSGCCHSGSGLLRFLLLFSELIGSLLKVAVVLGMSLAGAVPAMDFRGIFFILLAPSIGTGVAFTFSSSFRYCKSSAGQSRLGTILFYLQVVKSLFKDRPGSLPGI